MVLYMLLLLWSLLCTAVCWHAAECFFFSFSCRFLPNHMKDWNIYVQWRFNLAIIQLLLRFLFILLSIRHLLAFLRIVIQANPFLSILSYEDGHRDYRSIVSSACKVMLHYFFTMQWTVHGCALYNVTSSTSKRNVAQYLFCHFAFYSRHAILLPQKLGVHTSRFKTGKLFLFNLLRSSYHKSPW
jgi:hypothetical protein